MAGKVRIDPVATPPQTAVQESAGTEKNFISPEMADGSGSRNQPARPDPRTGEVRAGPGDAGLARTAEVNAGSPGTKQMSNKRLGIGLGLAALLAILASFATTL